SASAPSELHSLSLHDALPILGAMHLWDRAMTTLALMVTSVTLAVAIGVPVGILCARSDRVQAVVRPILDMMQTMPAFVYLVPALDRKSTRLNSSHVKISYAVF